jgi:hypothetical protein
MAEEPFYGVEPPISHRARAWAMSVHSGFLLHQKTRAATDAEIECNT